MECLLKDEVPMKLIGHQVNRLSCQKGIASLLRDLVKRDQ